MSIITRTYNTGFIEKLRFVGKQVGNTALYTIKNLLNKPEVTIYAKLEWQQLSGSVKAKAAFNIFRSAIEEGILTEEKTLLDATSGNTGIAYATIGKLLNIPVTLCLPENASKERKEILESLGTNIIYTSRFEGTDGAQQEASRLALENPNKYFYADQYKNDNNWKAHYHSTALEIYEALPGITHFVAGLGTTGTFVGTGRRFNELNPAIQLISLQPDIALHGLEGWKHLETASVPKIYDNTVADENLEVSTEEAYDMMKAAYKHEGLLLSPSSAANLAGAIRIAKHLDEGVVVTMFPDNADKYSEVVKKNHPMISIQPIPKDLMIEDGINSFPDECCGFFYGEEDNDGNRYVTEMLVVNNAKEGDKRRRFEISPGDYMKGEQYALERNLQLLGVYHSHPNHLAIPSEQDRIAAQPYFSYIIISVMNDNGTHLRSWRLNDSFQFEEEKMNNQQSNIIKQ